MIPKSVINRPVSGTQAKLTRRVATWGWLTMDEAVAEAASPPPSLQQLGL
jgi:hypothetical protein